MVSAHHSRLAGVVGGLDSPLFFFSLVVVFLPDLRLQVGAALAEKLLDVEQELSSLQGAASALCSHMLGGGPDSRASTARLEAVGGGHVEMIIIDGFFIGVHAAFTATASCFEGVDYAVVSSGYARGGRYEEDLDQLSTEMSLHA